MLSSDLTGRGEGGGKEEEGYEGVKMTGTCGGRGAEGTWTVGLEGTGDVGVVEGVVGVVMAQGGGDGLTGPDGRCVLVQAASRTISMTSAIQKTLRMRTFLSFLAKFFQPFPPGKKRNAR